LQDKAMQFLIMKRRDDQITLRLAGSLRAELERAAAEDGRSVSNLIRTILADFAAQRVVDRSTQAA
jgi:uncharacterized protein (DUF1778 family)